MNKLVPIAILFGALACGYYLFVQDAIEQANSRIEMSESDKAARRAAEAGYVRGAQLLHESFTDSSFSGTYASDSFRVNIDVIGNRAVVSAVGRARGHDSLKADHVVRVEYRRNREIARERPVFMEYALLAGGNLVASDSLLFRTNSSEKDRRSLIHVNGCLDGVVDRVLLNGTSVSHQSVPVCRPNVSQSSRFNADSIAIEPLYAEGVTLESHSHKDSDFVLSGRIGDGAPPRSPYVVHVSGDLIISDDVLATGYVLILVDGNVFIHGDLRSALIDSPESTVALYAGGSIAVIEEVAITAQLYSASDFHVFDPGAAILGSVTSRRDIQFDGPVTIDYRPSSPALTTNWVRPQDHIELVSYEEQ